MSDTAAGAFAVAQSAPATSETPAPSSPDTVPEQPVAASEQPSAAPEQPAAASQQPPAAPEQPAAVPETGNEAPAATAPAPAGQEGMTAPPAGEPADVEIEALTPGTMEAMVDKLSSFIDLGGPVVALLLAMSVFALAIILVKLWQFLLGTGASQKKISAAVSLWLAQDYEKALAAIGALKGPVANVVAFVMNGAAKGRDEAHLREEAEHLALSEIASLRSYLRGLEAVAQVAPLLGLFGTVLGMIEAFRSLEAAGAQVNPADLAGGIWVALLTTAVGLAVAMPVSLVLHWFEGRADRIRTTMELFTTEVMTNPPLRIVEGSKHGGPRVRLAHVAEGRHAV